MKTRNQKKEKYENDMKKIYRYVSMNYKKITKSRIITKKGTKNNNNNCEIKRMFRI